MALAPASSAFAKTLLAGSYSRRTDILGPAEWGLRLPPLPHIFRRESSP